MKMKLIETIEDILILEYSQKIINNLIQKFKSEDSSATDEVIKKYIQDFKDNSNKFENKDITKYKWKDLKDIVDNNRTKRIKAGKIDDTAVDANLLYNKDGYRLYHGKDKKACIKYGNGYSFCISSRGPDNAYDRYRRTSNGNFGTPYFVFNDNLEKKNINHLLVVYTIDKRNGEFNYMVTPSNNRGEEMYSNMTEFLINYNLPIDLVKLIIPQELSDNEKQLENLKKEQHQIHKNIQILFDNLFDIDIMKYSSYMDEVTLLNGIKDLCREHENAYEMIMSKKDQSDFTQKAIKLFEREPKFIPLFIELSKSYAKERKVKSDS